MTSWANCADSGRRSSSPAAASLPALRRSAVAAFPTKPNCWLGARHERVRRCCRASAVLRTACCRHSCSPTAARRRPASTTPRRCSTLSLRRFRPHQPRPQRARPSAPPASPAAATDSALEDPAATSSPGALPPAFPRWKSTASGTGTAASSPTRRSNTSSTAARTRTRWCCRSTCGARAANGRGTMDVLERMGHPLLRTRHGAVWWRWRRNRSSLKELIRACRPPAAGAPAGRACARLDDRVFNIIHLIYQSKTHEQHKDYARPPPVARTLGQRPADMTATLDHPEFFALPDRDIGVATHDVHRLARQAQGAGEGWDSFRSPARSRPATAAPGSR